MNPDRFKSLVYEAGYAFSRTRKVRKYIGDDSFLDKIQSSWEEMETDWYHACAYTICQLLKHKKDFLTRTGPEVYAYLEKLWLTEIKKCLAFSNWREREKTEDEGNHLIDFYEACNQLREIFTNPDIKLQSKDFKIIERYISDRYLVEGKFDESKGVAESLIRTKASRVFHTTRQDDSKNWEDAKQYIELFYENIIPAVTDSDRDRRFSHISNVLRAFQFSEDPNNQLFIINSFEAALVIFFIPPQSINNYWPKNK